MYSVGKATEPKVLNEDERALKLNSFTCHTLRMKTVVEKKIFVTPSYFILVSWNWAITRWAIIKRLSIILQYQHEKINSNRKSIN